MIKKEIVEKCLKIIEKIPPGYGYITFYWGYTDDTEVNIIPNYIVTDFENKKDLLYKHIIYSLDIIKNKIDENKEKAIYMRVYIKGHLIKKIPVNKNNIDDILLSALNDMILKYIIESI